MWPDVPLLHVAGARRTHTPELEDSGLRAALSLEEKFSPLVPNRICSEMVHKLRSNSVRRQQLELSEPLTCSQVPGSAAALDTCTFHRRADGTRVLESHLVSRTPGSAPNLTPTPSRRRAAARKGVPGRAADSQLHCQAEGSTISAKPFPPR